MWSFPRGSAVTHPLPLPLMSLPGRLKVGKLRIQQECNGGLGREHWGWNKPWQLPKWGLTLSWVDTTRQPSSGEWSGKYPGKYFQVCGGQSLAHSQCSVNICQRNEWKGWIRVGKQFSSEPLKSLGFYQGVFPSHIDVWEMAPWNGPVRWETLRLPAPGSNLVQIFSFRICMLGLISRTQSPRMSTIKSVDSKCPIGGLASSVGIAWDSSSCHCLGPGPKEKRVPLLKTTTKAYWVDFASLSWKAETLCYSRPPHRVAAWDGGPAWGRHCRGVGALHGSWGLDRSQDPSGLDFLCADANTRSLPEDSERWGKADQLPKDTETRGTTQPWVPGDLFLPLWYPSLGAREVSNQKCP